MKKKLLFVNESLALAGGEKSLIALLSNIDKEKYNVDLQLFRNDGPLFDFLPEYVNVLPPLPYTSFAENSWFKNFFSLSDVSKIKFFISKIKYSLKLRRRELNHPEKAQLYWETIGKVIDENPKQYDVAIAYAQGIPTFYTMDKISAKRKVAWINVNVRMSSANKHFQSYYYKKYNKIVTVSEATQDYITDLLPELREKITTIRDIIDYRTIKRLSEKPQNKIASEKFKILTVARLNKPQKGYDILLEACKILKERKIQFHWYVIGEGPYKKEMEWFIAQNNLSDCFTFLGTMANPYPYYKAVDLYVQTSRHEGFGLAIAEARLLNIPVVTTRFDTVFMQMIHEKNGLVVDIDAGSVATAIEHLIKTPKRYGDIVHYLEHEEKENYESVYKFDELIEELTRC